MATLEMLMLGEQRGHDDDFCHGHYNGQPKGGTKITQLSENTITPESWSLKLPLHLGVTAYPCFWRGAAKLQVARTLSRLAINPTIHRARLL